MSKRAATIREERRSLDAVQTITKKFVRGTYGKKTINASSSDNAVPLDTTGATAPAVMSYQTPIAVKLDDHRIAVNPNTYTTTSSRCRDRVIETLEGCGYERTDRTWVPPEKIGRFDPVASDPFVIYRR